MWTYGWQDDLVAVLERATGRRVTGERRRRAWYGDSGALRISSFLGLGTLLMPLALLAIMDQLSFYLLYFRGKRSGALGRDHLQGDAGQTFD